MGWALRFSQPEPLWDSISTSPWCLISLSLCLYFRFPPRSTEFSVFSPKLSPASLGHGAFCVEIFFFFFIFGRFLYDFPSSLVSNPFRFKLLTAGRSDIFYPQNRSLSSHPVNSCRVCSSPHESGHGSVLLETAPASAQLHRVVTGLSSPRRCFHFQLIPRQPPDRGGFFFMLCLPAPAINCN